MQRGELKRWAKEHMKGVENATLPSFTPDLKKLHEEAIRHDVRQAVKHGFFSTLAAVEVGLTFEEQKQLLSIVADEAKGKIFTSVPILCDSMDETYALLKHAKTVGCHTALLGYPATYQPGSADEIYRLTRELCDSVPDLGIVLYPSPHYNFQRLHNAGFPIEVLARLVDDCDNVVAMKAGEPGLYADCHRRFGDKIAINNPVERFLPMQVLGYGQQWIGAGCYEVLQSPETRYLVEYFRLLREKKVDQAMDIYWKLTPARVTFERQFLPTTMLGTYHWHRHKFYQWCVGGNGGLTRQPSMKIHQHEIEMTRFGYRAIGIEPREPQEEFFVGRLNYETAAGKAALLGRVAAGA